MSKIVCSIFLLFFLFLNGLGQNLVLNGSFEQFNTCPDQLPSNMSACYSWQNPNISSPDYFHACAPLGSGFSTPYNAVGWQQAKDSAAYVGIFCFDKNNPDTREYVTGQLTSPLVANIKYSVSLAHILPLQLLQCLMLFSGQLLRRLKIAR
jgi:hypothetical protein